LTELRAADLRFNLRETSVFFRQVMGLELSKKNASTLEDRTEGWIAGLQLAALSIRGQENAAEIIAAFDGRQRYVMDYLLEEVLQRQPEEVREFLYQTSILDSLTASLCDAMTGRTDGATHLAYLERSNLFLIPLDDRREWYRYHHLFADILRAQIPARDRIELHRKAAEWHEANGFLAEAVKHAVATGDTEATGRAIANAAPEALNHGQVITLLGWLGALPDEHIRARFWLSLFKSWALEMTGEIEASGSYIDSAEKNLPSDSSRLEHGACTTVQAYLAYDRRDWTDAICLFEKALDLIEESNSGMKSAILVGLAQAQYAEGDVATSARSFRKAYDIGRKSGNFHAGYSAMSQLAWLLLEQGQRREVAALCEQSIERSADSRGNPLPISGLVHVALGHAYYQANELTRARQHLLTGLDLLARTHFLFHTVWGKTVLHRVHNALGDKSAAREVLEDTQLTLESLPSARTFFAACEADSNSRSGNITDAERWLAAHFSPADTAKPWQRNLYLLYARIQLAKGRQQEALQALSAIEPVLRRADGLSQMLPGGYFCTLTDLLILQALAEQAAGRQEAAFSRLEEAVQRSAPEGCHRVFLEEGATVAKLLPGVRSAAPEFVDQLIADFHAEAERRTSRIPDRTLTEPLTRRELEVLRLTKDGLRNQEIADRLVVSVDTVKRHLSNIYRKLGVSHRTQAIVCAQELHLI
jgi:LuxR family maltose regulon positive regulatory protein